MALRIGPIDFFKISLHHSISETILTYIEPDYNVLFQKELSRYTKQSIIVYGDASWIEKSSSWVYESGSYLGDWETECKYYNYFLPFSALFDNFFEIHFWHPRSYAHERDGARDDGVTGL